MTSRSQRAQRGASTGTFTNAWYPNGVVGQAVAPGGDFFFLMEDGVSYFLMEDGVSKWLLEGV